jgi:hypothetical protein
MTETIVEVKEPVRQFEIGIKRKANRNEGKIKPLEQQEVERVHDGVKMLERGEIGC